MQNMIIGIKNIKEVENDTDSKTQILRVLRKCTKIIIHQRKTTEKQTKKNKTDTLGTSLKKNKKIASTTLIVIDV